MAGALAALAGLMSHGAGAEESAAPAVSLDKLLELPTALPVERPKERGGSTRLEWRERYAKAQAEVAEARAALDEAMAKLKELAAETGGMKVSGPGSGAFNPDTPMNYGLSQEIRRKREAVDKAERDLIDLGVEADLAGVPREWLEDPKADEASGRTPGARLRSAAPRAGGTETPAVPSRP